MLANGETKPISEVAFGDEVLATNPDTGHTTAREVLAVWVMPHDGDLLDVTISGLDGTTGVVETTDGHKFWSVTVTGWVEAQHLTAGEQLRQPDGTTASVVTLTPQPGQAHMWDLTVAVDHTFYVGAGGEAVLVHNCNFTDIGSGADLIRQTDIDGVAIRVKSGHGYRTSHGSVDITSVASRDAVDRAVANDLASRVSSGTTISRAGSGRSTFTTTVAGHTVEYRAVFVPATGRYEIGTYYIP